MTEYENSGFERDEQAQMSASDQAQDAMLDALLVRFGGDYNRPPDIVPREEMWHAIGRKNVSRIFIHRHPAWSGLAAAVLLLGAGIGIGVDVHSHLTTPAQSVATLPPEAGPTNSATPGSSIAGSVVPSLPHGAAEATTQRTQPRLPGAAGTETYASANTAASNNTGARSAAYTLATVRHFTAVEALLTSFQTSQHDARGDAQMAAWSRALLSQTRLLLDSPAASDPVRRKLLQDLELVLVQMTQLSPSDTPIDREMIDGSVRNNDVITRLRSAVPAGGATHL
jgi:hypothetical protein